MFSVYKILKVLFIPPYYHKKSHLKKSTRYNSRTFEESNISNVGSWEARRDMGYYESYLCDLDHNFGTKIYTVIFLKSRISLRREPVRNALLLLTRKHPLLRANLDDHARGFSFYQNFQDAGVRKKQFVILRDRQFRPELRFINTSHWRIVLEEELLINKVDSYHHRDSLWRTILLREQYHASEGLYTNSLLFLFDQVIMDRRAVVNFMQDFMNFLCKLVNCDIHMNDTLPLKLEGPAEELLKEPPFWKQLSLMVEETLKNVYRIGTNSAAFHIQNLEKKASVRPLFITKSLSTEETSQLLYWCEEKSCCLTSLFTAAWLLVQRSHSEKENVGRVDLLTMPVSVNVDFRSSMSTTVPTSYLGNSSSSISLILPTGRQDKSTFLETVNHLEHLFNSAIKSEKHLDIIRKLKYCNPRTKANLIEKFAFEIADVGHFDLEETNPFELKEMYIGASGTSEESLTLVVINNKLYCGMQWNSHSDAGEYSASLNDLIAVIKHLCCEKVHQIVNNHSN